ncbi:MAG: type II toxin-antitoxin system HicB family antitoxin [Rhizobiaceae bacterium]|nr:MAG: type II toxin-antitoxin system HicB family antitoxin [Rhizobiaceae bacterium]
MGIYLKGLDFYPATISRQGDRYLARFVDIPNCIAFGPSAIEAEINATHALASHFRFLGNQVCVLPDPWLIGGPEQSRDSYVAYIRSPIDHSPAAGAGARSLAKAA